MKLGKSINEEGLSRLTWLILLLKKPNQKVHMPNISNQMKHTMLSKNMDVRELILVFVIFFGAISRPCWVSITDGHLKYQNHITPNKCDFYMKVSSPRI